MQTAEWNQKMDGFGGHAVAFGLYLKALGNQKRFSVVCYMFRFVFGRVTSVFQRLLTGGRQLGVRS